MPKHSDQPARHASAAVFFALSSRKLLNWMPDQLYLSAMWRAYFHKKLDWKNPKSFNEKVQWLKVKDRNPLYPTLVDKYAVRAWIKEKIGEEYLVPLVGGPWSSFDEIDFGALLDAELLHVDRLFLRHGLSSGNEHRRAIEGAGAQIGQRFIGLR